MRFYRLILTLLIAGCTSIVPATHPPQLEHTPGAPLVITADSVRTETFQADYPDGWRVIKISVASDPMRLVFAAPDNTMTITLSETPADDPTLGEERVQTTAGGIYLWGQTTEADRTRFDAIYNAVRQSIR